MLRVEKRRIIEDESDSESETEWIAVKKTRHALYDSYEIRLEHNIQDTQNEKDYESNESDTESNESDKESFTNSDSESDFEDSDPEYSSETESEEEVDEYNDYKLYTCQICGIERHPESFNFKSKSDCKLLRCLYCSKAVSNYAYGNYMHNRQQKTLGLAEVAKRSIELNRLDKLFF